jgi:hypothetical protein
MDKLRIVKKADSCVAAASVGTLREGESHNPLVPS